MQTYWQLKASRYAIFLIIGLAFLPLILSFVIQSHYYAQIIILILTPVFLYLLYKNIVFPYTGKDNILTWQNGVWVFSNKTTSIQGKKNNRSFSFGNILLLSIRDNNNKSLELWLFPDSIYTNDKGWRHLHCCFYLSETNSQ